LGLICVSSTAKVNKATPNKAAPGTRTASTTTRPGGIFLNRTVKAEGDPDVPASLWALADAALGSDKADKSEKDPAPQPEVQEEAESDNVDVKEALDESSETRITR
jgi:hypothetical protein